MTQEVLAGKIGLVFGVANKRSIAWAIAQKLNEAGLLGRASDLKTALKEKERLYAVSEHGVSFVDRGLFRAEIVPVNVKAGKV